MLRHGHVLAGHGGSLEQVSERFVIGHLEMHFAQAREAAGEPVH